jgi:benzoyl-CoA-dihydrodiol lyase
VVVSSAKEKVFCAGANIRMLAESSHAWKVNFCKFTNETRNGMEDASAHSGQTYLAALNGNGVGRRLRDRARVRAHHAGRRPLVDGVDAGTAAAGRPAGHRGLTRLVDKRHVRRDRADYFATKAEGIGGRKAAEWGLVDEGGHASEVGPDGT